MGSVSSGLQGVKDDLVATQRELAIKSRLMDLKQKKRERDMQVSMQMATTRDRVWCVCLLLDKCITVL
jgi:hypothetical protein